MASDPRFESLLSEGAAPAVVEALREAVEKGADNELVRVNPLVFAAQRKLDEQQTIGAFLRSSRLGLFDLTWSIHCPKCTGSLDAHGSSRAIRQSGYYCTSCDVSPDVSLDSIVEATFTVNPRTRAIAAHQPETLSIADYLEHLHFSTRMPASSVATFLANFALAAVDIPAGASAEISFTAEPGLLLVTEQLTHSATLLMAEGEPATEPSRLTFIFTGESARHAPRMVRPGRVNATVENRSSSRMGVIVHPINDALRALMATRQPFLTAKRLFTHPTFREMFRTDALDIEQKLKIESLTILFTDLKSSTELYERVGDLPAFDLVRKHFAVLEDAVKANQGSVVKTIGDAVMAAFPSPDHGLEAALQMRESLAAFNQRRKHEDLLVKIGLHDGPCLAVMLNERLDYFGQTVNIAARVQGLAEAQSILVTRPILNATDVSRLVEERGLQPTERRASLKGIREEMTLYELA